VSDSSNQAKSIFLAAIEEHRPEQWPGFLDQACAGDVRLRGEVEKLLRSRSELGSFHEPRGQPRLAEALERLVQLYDAWGKPDQATRWRRELESEKALATK
jgi:hypothetical protein